MQFYYGEQNILRALDETEFWKRQESEHAGLIPVVVQNLETPYVHRLEQFGLELSTMNAEAVKYITSITRSKGVISREKKFEMLNFVKRCISQSEDFIALMTEMLQSSESIQTNPPAQVLLRHMIRESEYFIGIGQLILG